jgi:hypothetical protein
MAKKAKRRGRPPGSKNKKSIGKSVATMDIAQLRAHIDSLQGQPTGQPTASPPAVATAWGSVLTRWT